MKREFRKYERLKAEGVSAEQVYLIAEEDGADLFMCLNILQTVFGCSPIEAKEISVTANGEAESLAEHQGKLVAGLGQALKSEEASD